MEKDHTLNPKSFQTPEAQKAATMTWQEWVALIIKIIEDIINNLPKEHHEYVRSMIRHEMEKKL